MDPNRRQCLVILGTLISFSLRFQECVSFTVLSRAFWSMPMRDTIVTTMKCEDSFKFVSGILLTYSIKIALHQQLALF